MKKNQQLIWYISKMDHFMWITY